MKLKKFYESVIEVGKARDPRGTKTIAAEIQRLKDSLKEASDKTKKRFDQERLKNPYADTRILNGDPEKDIKTILVGIDIEVGELVMADRLNQKGKKIDLVLSHHPEGKALAGLYRVMYMQADILHKYGVPINVAEGVLDGRIKEVERRLMPSNLNRSVDAARLLDITFMCAHTPADNCVARYLQGLFDKKRPVLVDDVVKIIEDIPEYKRDMERGMYPKIVAGSGAGRAGKVFVDMTGGTEGSDKIFAKMEQAGIGTVVGMHFSEKHIQEAKKCNINMVIAGHMASDNVGINLLLDEITKKEKLNIIDCSGFVRVKR